MPLVLTDEDVRTAVSMADAVAAIEAACREQADGKALLGERQNVRLPNGWIRLMPAGLLSSGVLGYKEFHLIHDQQRPTEVAHVRYAFHLIDLSDGRLLAMLDANYLTAIRTGAATGVATKYLAPENASTVGLIGSGSEARTQLAAVAAVRSISRAKVYSRGADNRERFAREMGERLGIAITPVERPEEAVDGVDIVVAATNTAGTGPALCGRWLRKGVYVCSIGSTMATQREIDPEVWAVSDRVVVDTRRLLHESGDALAAREAGTIDEAKVIDLPELVMGKGGGHARPGETVLYKSVGTGIQDVAVAYRAYQQAKARGLGREIGDYQSVKDVEPN